MTRIAHLPQNRHRPLSLAFGQIAILAMLGFLTPVASFAQTPQSSYRPAPSVSWPVQQPPTQFAPQPPQPMAAPQAGVYQPPVAQVAWQQPTPATPPVQPIGFPQPVVVDPARGMPVAPPAPMPLPPAPSEPHPHDVMARLERVEAALAAGHIPIEGIQDPDVAPLGSLGEYWQGVQDPEIETIAQQTYHSRDMVQKPGEKPKKWYDKLSIRGYAQFRINGILDEDPAGAPAQHTGDRSVGDDQNFLIRRARVILSGDVSDHMYVYLQPDFASSVPGSTDANQFTQIRDWYADCYLDIDKVHRIRVGQSKIPYGWENLQSSSNRLVLDRNDALNSAVRNERDLGVFYYYTPKYAQDFFKMVLDEGLKGSGNYGMFGFGAHNGQGGSLQEQNDNIHIVTRLTLPWQFENGQCVETGIQAYTGKYTVLGSTIFPGGGVVSDTPDGTSGNTGKAGIRDERIAATFVYYPQPFGFQAEWNVGRGPGLNDAQTEVIERHLYGGYAMMMYRYETACYGTWIPFLRYNKYKGGYKPERNAPFSFIEEWEAGAEWQINPQMELTLNYTLTDRTNTTAINRSGELSYRQFEGDLLRCQFQVNY